MKKYKMPTVQEFLNKKTIYGPKKDPVWVYLEREMRENAQIKPYNEKVGAWLKFLRDFRFFKFQEGKRNLKRLEKEVGPAWYCQLSEVQKQVLNDLKSNIHQDLIEDVPTRTRKSLSDLGVTLKIPKTILMKAMAESIEDAGIFIWNLYTYCYKKPPSHLRGEYDMNAMILMSSLVFIDLKECIESLENLTKAKKEEVPIIPKSYPKNFKPDVKYGDYLQVNYIPPYSKYSDMKKESKPLPLGNKVKLRSQSSYEKLCEDKSFADTNNTINNILLQLMHKNTNKLFIDLYITVKQDTGNNSVDKFQLEKRKERNKKEKPKERICTYKFWEAPSTLRNSDPKLVAYLNQLKMLKKKARVKHNLPYDNVQYHIGPVVFCGGRPHYLLNNVALLPTGYIPINGGAVQHGKEIFCNIQGYWKFPKEVKEECDEMCDCLEKWENQVMKYLKGSKCKCGHLYDFYHGDKLKEKYFYPPSKHGPFWLDYAKIYQMDPMEDFIRDTLQGALSSGLSVSTMTPTILPSGLNEKQLLGAFLGELSDTPLIIPHLPQANLLNNLQEWVRKRVKGKIPATTHKQLILQSQRRWLNLKHMDFRARAFRIPFTLKQLHNMTWSHRHLVQKLFEKLLNDFVSRNRLKQLEQTRLWWSTTKYDAYPSEAFLHIFFTYMPGRMKDTFLINPYSAEVTKKSGAKTCPLDR